MSPLKLVSLLAILRPSYKTMVVLNIYMISLGSGNEGSHTVAIHSMSSVPIWWKSMRGPTVGVWIGLIACLKIQIQSALNFCAN